jgi:biotin-dependent carboxylase-like uncharacterized protein
LANLLVGNKDNAAVLEMTGVGAALKFDEAQVVAVCGADMQGSLNDVPFVNWSSFVVPQRGELRFGVAIEGYRTYVAVRGGFEVPIVLGSRSTYTHANIGGQNGRTLRRGEVLYTGQDIAQPVKQQKISKQYIPKYAANITLRVILGPQDNMFSREAINAFFQSSYTVTAQSNRTGYRLDGYVIKTIDKVDIVSDAVCLGAIQIPANGRPLIATADHQPTRGFAKLGCIIRVDLAKLAQAKPGDTINFVRVAEHTAVEALNCAQQQYTRIAKEVMAIQ